MSVPDGLFDHDLIIFGDPAKGGSAARGFRVEAPDTRGMPDSYVAETHDRLVRMLRLLGDGQRMQIRWRRTRDYDRELTAYEERTAAVKNPILREHRRRRSQQLRKRLAAGLLLREDLRVFVACKRPAAPPMLATPSAIQGYYQQYFSGLASTFTTFGQNLQNVLGNETRVQAMTDLDHFAYWLHVLNPSFDSRSQVNHKELFRPDLSIQENCFLSTVGGEGRNNFVTDGHYHTVLQFDRPGTEIGPGIIHPLTELKSADYEIVVNLWPEDKKRHIKQEEQRIDQLTREQEKTGNKASRAAEIEMDEAKVKELTKGNLRPYRAMILIHVWDKTSAGLQTKVQLVQGAINAMSGAQYYHDTLRSTVIGLYRKTFPGWLFDSPQPSKVLDDRDLADLIPFSSSFHGALDGAEALYESDNGALCGYRSFHGTPAFPNHTGLLGATGAGKSELARDIHFQTGDYFDFEVFIEEGNEHEEYTRAQGCTPLVIHPDSLYTFNYNDTGGLPLSKLHRSFRIALCQHMAGRSEDERLVARRAAQISQYLTRLDVATYDEWAKRNFGLIPHIEREACAVYEWLKTRMTREDTPLDSFNVIRQGIAAKNDEILSYIAGITEEQITRFTKDPLTERLVMEHAFAYFKPEDYGQHTALVEIMAASPLPEHPAQEIYDISTLLRNWTATEGEYGKLLDGVTNLQLTGRVVHFELGSIPESQPELKTAVALLITGLVRTHIMSMPRTMRKRFTAEELMRFLGVPGGEKLIEESAAQLRKYGCQLFWIIQQYSKFRNTPIRPVLMGNTPQFLITRQDDLPDIRAIAEDTGLARSMATRVSQYVAPTNLPTSDQYSSACYFNKRAYPMISGTLRHRKPASAPNP